MRDNRHACDSEDRSTYLYIQGRRKWSGRSVVAGPVFRQTEEARGDRGRAEPADTARR